MLYGPIGPQLRTMIASLDPADAALVREIFDAEDQVTVAALIRTYYRDLDRAERTPRGLLYLHLGMLSGVIDALMRGSVH
jgi:hypothetical protein